MKKQRINRFKKITALFMGATFAMSAFGCGSKGKKDDKASQTDAGQIPAEMRMEDPSGMEIASDAGSEAKTTYGYTEILMGQYQGNPIEVVSNQDGIYFCTTTVGGLSSESDAGSEVYRFYKASLSDETAELLGEYEGRGLQVADLEVDSTGNVSALLFGAGASGSIETITRVEAKDGKLKATDLTDDISRATGGEYISDAALGENGELIAMGPFITYGLDADMAVKFQTKAVSQSDVVGYLNSGDVCSMGDSSAGARLTVMDSKSGKEKQSLATQADYMLYAANLLRGSDGYDAYITDSKGVYGISLGDKTRKTVIDYEKSNLNAESLNSIAPLESGIWVAAYRPSSMSEKAVLVKMEAADDRAAVEKVEITFANLWGDGFYTDQIQKFNQENSQYKIKEITYYEEEDPEGKLSADIAAGNAPDIIAIENNSLGNMPIQQAVDKGYLENLLPYMEKDPEVSLDQMLPGIQEAIKIKGGVYCTSPYFTPFCIVGKKSVLPAKSQWTFGEFVQFVDSQPEDLRLFYEDDKYSVIANLMQESFSRFVDWESGKYDFDNEDFKNLLRIAKRGKAMDRNGDGMNEWYSLNKNMFAEPYVGARQLQMDNLYAKEELTILPCSSQDGKGTKVLFSQMAGIYAGSKHKDVAWQFLRTFYTKEYQSSTYMNREEIPTRKDMFDAYIKLLEAVEPYTDEFGNQVTPMAYGMQQEDGSFITGAKLPDDDVQQLKEALNHIDPKSWSISPITDIVIEESQAYFNGDKDADQVAKIIQDRVTTYINENK